MKKAVKLNNNETYYYLEAGLKNSETMLMIHGNMSSGVHYEPLIKELEDYYHILAPDMRGFGDSSYNKPLVSLEDLADDLKLFLEALNISNIILIGWSTGGGVALKFAAKYSQMVTKLVLLESASYRGYPVYKKDSQYQPLLGELYQSKDEMSQDPVQVAPVALALSNNNIAFMEQVWKAVIYNQKVPNDDYLARYLAETMKQRNLIDIDWALMTFNMSNYSNGVTAGDGSITYVVCPVLSIYGRKDLVVPYYMFEETYQAIKNISTAIFDQFSHSPMTDDPNLLAKTILEFILKS